ncbi:cupin domain-containing protein [Methylobacterium frigidaeris]|uniref:Oxalate decarboxylase OxdD n=2 Tax=Methylobacterium frigidaeris TaxID=2038277 RepID=A0AA37H8R9_9HYPH|nr:cupin domain-containing protein [Methylobacterium frigidaeris]GJD60870.1 Oxalate decarboxylase OxdD [Methylobacterium frigidaeris]
MDALSRRGMLALAATGSLAAATSARAAEFGNPDRPPQGALNASPGALADPGPQSPPLAAQFPAAQNPPATDVGDMQTFWSSFNTAHRRIQSGGWARQVTQADFPISTAVSGVNMRLSAGGIREMHWHLAAEWAYMTAGRCRITYLDAEGHASVQDVAKGDLWYFPAGMPHSLQGLGPEGCEFLIVFDDGNQSEFGTLLVTDWLAHTPPEDLALNFGLPAEAFRSIPLDDLWIFQGRAPGPLAADQVQVASAGTPPEPVTFSLDRTVPVRENRSGRLQMADSRTFKASKTIAAAIEVIKPGAMREMHWHPNADEWQYYVQGEGRMTVFGAGPRAQTADFRAGDLGYVKKSNGHYVKNTGTTDLIFLAVFKTAQYQEISLSDWLTHTPPELVAQHLNIDPALLARMSKDRPGLVPA